MNIDILTCYVLSGVGGILGLGLMNIIPSDQPRIAHTLRIFKWALVFLSFGSLLISVPEPLIPSVLKVLVGFIGTGVALLIWAFRELNGQATRPLTGIILAVLPALALWIAGAFFSDAMFISALALVFMILSVAMAIDQGLIILQSRRGHGSEIGLMSTALVFAFFCTSLFIHVSTNSGPYPRDWFYFPAWLRPFAGLTLALLPLAVATLVFATISARLTHKLRTRTLSDDLTGCLSRRGLCELGERMMAAQSSIPTQVAVLMIDLDHFKTVNDCYGHLIGDQVLRHISSLIRENLRKDALLARYGGEEFSILLPVQHTGEATSIAERLRQTVEANPCETKFGPISCTVSIGVSFHKPDSSLEEDLAKADTRLYAAKKSGRNRVDCASNETWSLNLV